MNTVHLLYEKSYHLLHMGEDGQPLYADELSALNKEVDHLSSSIYGYTVTTLENEAELCRALLVSFAATYTSNPEKTHRLNEVLNRVYHILGGTTSGWPGLTYPDGLIRAQLTLFTYTFTYDEELLTEVARLIQTWEGRELTREEFDLVELYTTSQL